MEALLRTVKIFMMLNILIVEDEIEFRNYLTHAIAWEDYGMNIAASASDVGSALEILNSINIDLVLLDLTLKKRNGMDLAKAIQDLGTKPRIIAITGHSEFEIVQQALRLGLDDYLLKPFARQELLMSILSVREQLLERIREETINTNLQETMTDAWLYQLSRSASSTEVEYLVQQLTRCGLHIPGSPRIMLCCSLISDEGDPRILNRWIGHTTALWKTAVEQLPALVWSGFDGLIYILVGGDEASELEWDIPDLAREFLNQLNRHLSYSLHIGISSVALGDEGSLHILGSEAREALSRADSQKAIRVWQRGWSRDEEEQETEEPRHTSKAVRHWYETAESFIERFHHDYSLDVQTVASHLGISTEYLRQAYRQCAGTSCIHAIILRRLSHAQALLQCRGVSIAEAADRSGFRDPAYFGRKFKQVFGITPGSYRQKCMREGQLL